MATAPEQLSPPRPAAPPTERAAREVDPRLLLLLLIPVGLAVAVGAFLSDHPELALALFLGFIIFVATGLRLELLLAAMIANLLMGSGRVFESPLLNLNRLLGLLILVGLLMRIFLLRAQTFNRAPLNIPVLAYAGAVFASVVFAENRGLSFGALQSYVRLFLLYFLVSHLVLERRWLRLYMLAMVGAGTLLVAVSAATSYNVYAQRTGGLGTYADFNFYGLVVAVLVPIAVWGFRCEPNPALRVFHFLGFCVLLVGVVQSGSRGALLALFVMAIVMIATGQLSTKVILPAILLAVLSLPFTSGKLIERFAAVFEIVTKGGRNLSGDAQNVMNRLVYIQAGIPMFLEHPVTGVGINGFGLQYLRYLPHEAKERRARAPHNTYLQVVTETGLLGAIPFFFILLGGFRGAHRLWRRTLPRGDAGEPNPHADPLVSSVALYLLYALTTWAVAATFVAVVNRDILWLLLGLVAGLPMLRTASPPAAAGAPLGR